MQDNYIKTDFVYPMDKKDYQSFNVRQTTVISGKIVAENEDSAKSDFRKDILDILRAHGYSAKIVSKTNP